MKKYITPELEITEFEKSDVIATSLGTETPPMNEGDGSWNLV